MERWNNWSFFYQACARVNQRIYLFIDEYDYFTNAILSDAERMRRYTDETHGEGYLRSSIKNKSRNLFQHRALFHY